MTGAPVRLRVFARPGGWEERGQTPSGRVAAASADQLPTRVPLDGGGVWPLVGASVTADGGLVACVACAHPELYTQKDFPRALGVAVVVVAAILAPFTAYLSLVAAAVVDAALFRFAPDVVVCYLCASEHRGFSNDPRHPAFDREIEERLRYGEKAVMGRPMREGGTAGAPEPEH